MKRADVNLLAETADIVFDADKVNARDIMAAVEDVGFGAALAEDDRGFAMEKARARREEEATSWCVCPLRGWVGCTPPIVCSCALTRSLVLTTNSTLSTRFYLTLVSGILTLPVVVVMWGPMIFTSLHHALYINGVDVGSIIQLGESGSERTFFFSFWNLLSPV